MSVSHSATNQLQDVVVIAAACCLPLTACFCCRIRMTSKFIWKVPIVVAIVAAVVVVTHNLYKNQ